MTLKRGVKQAFNQKLRRIKPEFIFVDRVRKKMLEKQTLLWHELKKLTKPLKVFDFFRKGFF